MKKEYTTATATSIKYWSLDDRPREKLVAKGPAMLSNAELLAILINSGTRRYSALDLARMVLEKANDNLRELGKLSIATLRETQGIGDARAITIAAALELGRRRQIADGLDRSRVLTSANAREIVIPLLADLPNEAFCVLYLNNACMLVKHEIISNGGLTSTTVDIRVILKQALLLNATRLIVAHNHPSGNTRPSEADKQLTIRLRDAAGIMDIDLLDHIIVAGSQTLSMADEEMMH
jgi:DNA repair protein RadC